MKRSPLRRRSKKADKWSRLYNKERVHRLETTTECELCKVRTTRRDGHHFAGSRHGANILRFFLCCRPCHDLIHQQPNWAREMGLLARISGEMFPPHPAAQRAEERWKELMQELNP